MNQFLPCLAALAPFTLAVAALAGTGGSARTVARNAIAAAALAFALAAVASLGSAAMGSACRCSSMRSARYSSRW